MTTLNEILKKDLEKYGDLELLLNENNKKYLKKHIDVIIKIVRKAEYNKKIDEQVKHLIDEGLCISEISKKTGIHYEKIRNIYLKLNIFIKNKGNDCRKNQRNQNIKIYKKLIKQGMSEISIAEKMGLSIKTIRSYRYYLCHK